MFSTICLIFVTLIISTNAGSPSFGLSSAEKCAVETPFYNSMKSQIGVAELNIKIAIDKYAANHSKQPIDAFVNGLEDVIEENNQKLQDQVLGYLDVLDRKTQGKYDFSCFDGILSALDNLYSSLKAYEDKIISEHH